MSLVTKVEDYLQRLPAVAQRTVEAYQLAAERQRAEEALLQWYPLRPPGGGSILADDKSGGRRETRTKRENDALAV
jgi:hypothetical protein